MRDNLEAARQMRLGLAAARGARPSSPRPGAARESFRLWWASNRRRYGRPRELEAVLWEHLVASGHDREQDFDRGLKHFGLEEKENK